MKPTTAPEGPSRVARIGSVFMLLGSLVWVQWPIDIERFNIAAVILFIGAFVAWISIELADYQERGASSDNIMSDDVDKLNSIIKIVDRKQFYILRKTYIQTYMGVDDYKGLQNLIYSKENDIFPFHNKNIQNIYEEFVDKSSEFLSEFYQIYTYDGNGRSTWRPSDGQYVSDEIYREIQDRIAVLDQKASKLADLWEELINVARHELKGASKAIERYEM